MRKPTFCMCENKGTDQLRSIHAADQRLSFSLIDSTIPHYFLNRTFELLAIFCCFTAQFVSDLVSLLEARFSHDVAQSLLETPQDWDTRFKTVRFLKAIGQVSITWAVGEIIINDL